MYYGHFRKAILAVGNRMNYWRSCFPGTGKTVERLGGRNDDMDPSHLDASVHREERTRDVKEEHQ